MCLGGLDNRHFGKPKPPQSLRFGGRDDYEREKIATSTKWPVTYLIILALLLAVIAAAIWEIVFYAQKNEGSMMLMGVIALVYMLPTEAVVLCSLNRRACWVWAENGCIKRKGLLFGFVGEDKI